MNHRTLTSAVALTWLAGTLHAQVTFEPLAAGFGPTDISADGEVVVGNSTSDDIYETFRWTRAGGVVRLGRSSGAAFGSGGGTPDVSYDGTRVSATIADATTSFITPGVWEEGVGWTDCMPPLLPASMLTDLAYGSAWGLSGDGETAVGLYWLPREGGGAKAHAYIWDPINGSATFYASTTLRSSRANAANFDGSVVVGWRDPTSGAWKPTAWVNGVEHILRDTDIGCQASSVNHDGSVIVGFTQVGTSISPSRRAAYWTWNGSSYDEHLIGGLPGTPMSSNGWSGANGIADDAMIVVGTNHFFSNGPFSDGTGFIWTPRTGIFDAMDYMNDNGVVFGPDVQISSLSGISADGSTILVNLKDTVTFELASGLLHIPVACSAADITTQGAGVGDTNYGMPDGVISGADINFYVNAWLSVDLVTGDVTTTGAGIGDPGYGVPDGQVTGADIQYYVNLWIAGCP